MLSIARRFQPSIRSPQFRTHYDRAENYNQKDQFDKTISRLLEKNMLNRKAKKVIEPVKSEIKHEDPPKKVDSQKTTEQKDALEVEREENLKAYEYEISSQQNSTKKVEREESFKEYETRFQRGLVASVLLAIHYNHRGYFYRQSTGNKSEEPIPPFHGNILKHHTWNGSRAHLIEIDMSKGELDYYESKIESLSSQGLKRLLCQLSICTSRDKHIDCVGVFGCFDKYLTKQKK
jgi:hypothetical protein